MEKELFFQEGNKLNFQPGLGMGGPSVNKTHLQPGFAACGAHELVPGSLLWGDTLAEEGTAEPFLRAGFAQMEREVPASLLHLQHR